MRCATGSFLDQYSRHMDEIYNAGFKTFLECRNGVVYYDELKAGRWSILGYYPATSLIDPATGIIQGALEDSGIMVGATWDWPGRSATDAQVPDHPEDHRPGNPERAVQGL